MSNICFIVQSHDTEYGDFIVESAHQVHIDKLKKLQRKVNEKKEKVISTTSQHSDCIEMIQGSLKESKSEKKKINGIRKR